MCPGSDCPVCLCSGHSLDGGGVLGMKSPGMEREVGRPGEVCRAHQS